MTDSAAVVERYFAIVADLDSTEKDLRALLHPDARVTEHPNAISPAGGVRDRDETLAGFLAGKRLLSAQTFDVHETLVAGDRVAVRATWRGTIAETGTQLVAHVAALLTVTDGLIREHETFDCYEPFTIGRPAPASRP